MSYSKSLFNNTPVFSNTRSLISPISFGFAIQTVDTGTDAEIGFLNDYYNNIIRIIQTRYSSQIASRSYDSIPTDDTQYNHLVAEVQQMRLKTTNPSIYLLLQIAEDSLRGAFNSIALYGDNLLLQIDKDNLIKQIEDIINNKNNEIVQTTVSSNDMTVTQRFSLSAVFNYYIRIYGVPAPGEGFDPVKISFLIYVLEKNGIDPYS